MNGRTLIRGGSVLLGDGLQNVDIYGADIMLDVPGVITDVNDAIRIIMAMDIANVSIQGCTINTVEFFAAKQTKKSIDLAKCESSMTVRRGRKTGLRERLHLAAVCAFSIVKG